MSILLVALGIYAGGARAQSRSHEINENPYAKTHSVHFKIVTEIFGVTGVDTDEPAWKIREVEMDRFAHEYWQWGDMVRWEAISGSDRYFRHAAETQKEYAKRWPNQAAKYKEMAESRTAVFCSYLSRDGTVYEDCCGKSHYPLELDANTNIKRNPLRYVEWVQQSGKQTEAETIANQQCERWEINREKLGTKETVWISKENGFPVKWMAQTDYVFDGGHKDNRKLGEVIYRPTIKRSVEVTTFYEVEINPKPSENLFKPAHITIAYGKKAYQMPPYQDVSPKQLFADPVENFGITNGSGLGIPAPKIQLARWIKNPPYQLQIVPGKTIKVLVLWATYEPFVEKDIKALDDLQKQFKGAGVVFVVVNSESIERQNQYGNTAVDFVRGLGDKMNVGVATDELCKTSLNFAVPYGVVRLPYAFVIDPNETVIWHGHPRVGLRQALEAVAAGTYDLESLKKIRPAR